MIDTTHSWDLSYDNARDYLACTTLDIENILSNTASSAPKTSLDIGSGTGQIPRELFHRGYTAIGIDGSVKAIKIARHSTVLADDKIQYIHANFEEFSASLTESQTYGLITCKYVFAFIDNRTAFLKKVDSLLDESGIFVVISPNIDTLPAEKTGIAVPHDEMLEILSAVFETISYERNRDIYYICRKRS